MLTYQDWQKFKILTAYSVGKMKAMGTHIYCKENAKMTSPLLREFGNLELSHIPFNLTILVLGLYSEKHPHKYETIYA